MRGPAALLLSGLLLAASGLAPAQAAERAIANGDQLNAWLGRCFHPPVGSQGSEITLLFMLDEHGALKGKPRITYSKLLGDEGTQKDFVAAALAMLRDCTPIPVTRDFGIMAANKLRAWRLMARQRPSGGI